MIDQDIIGHLIDVERQAYDLLLDAESEADKRKAKAKEEAEQSYRSLYARLIEQLEASFLAGQQLCDNSKKDEFTAFDTRLASTTKDPSSFNKYLDSLFRVQ